MNAPVLRMTANASYTRRLDQMFPGYFLGAKHNHYADFGYPTDPQFRDFYDAYQRNGLARAGVDKTIAKTWQDFPFILEKPRDAGESRKETAWEKRLRERFEDLRVWQHLAEADRRGMVGAYAGVILRLADSRQLREPVTTVSGGLMGLVEVIPAWEGQLSVGEWDTDQTSATYGQPKMYQFNEAAVGTSTQPRNFEVHPDRVLIWSRDGTVHGSSALKAGLNDVITAEKIIGAGGEGFWKNAKSAPVIEIDKEANVANMAKAMGVSPADLADKMDEQVRDWNQGFDMALVLQGMQAKALGITLPSPEHFFSIACQSFAASLQMPVKILVGMQTGERASTEDAEEWAQTNMSRRSSETRPNIMGLVRRLERFGMIPARDWSLVWTDLTEPKASEKIDRAKKMVEANQASVTATRERVFTGAEIRAVMDLEPLSDAEAIVEPPEEPEDEDVPDKGGRQNTGRPFVGNARRRRERRKRAGKGYDPTQPRGPNGRWIDTGKGSSPSLTAFLRSQRKEPGRQRTLDLGEVKNQTAISAAGGPDTRGYRRLIETHEANHALKEHGAGSPKWLRGSRLLKADFGRIEQVVAASGPVRVTRKKGGDVRIEYRAVLDGRTYRYIETVSKRRSALIFKTMWWVK
jgi:hypothetical protein